MNVPVNRVILMMGPPFVNNVILFANHVKVLSSISALNATKQNLIDNWLEQTVNVSMILI
jgi:hypothetical protein